MTKIADWGLRIAELRRNPKSPIRNPKCFSFFDRNHRTVSAQIGFGSAEVDPTGQRRQLKNVPEKLVIQVKKRKNLPPESAGILKAELERLGYPSRLVRTPWGGLVPCGMAGAKLLSIFERLQEEYRKAGFNQR